MLKIFNKIVFSFFLIITSCKSQNIEKQLRDCVNEQINEYHYYDAPNKFDFYDFILTVENKIIEEGLLKEINTIDYNQLLFSIINEKKNYKKTYEKIAHIFYENNYYIYSTDIVFNQCPYKVSKSGKGNEYDKLYLKGKILNEIMKAGYNDEKLISEFIASFSSKEFKKIEYRAPLILLVAVNMDIINNQTKN